MPAKSLIAFKNQPLQQLGIDPAFEEAGFGTSCSPAMNSGNEKRSVSGAHRHRGSFARTIQGKDRTTCTSRDVQTNLQSEI
jgi:hypothetical protein